MEISEEKRVKDRDRWMDVARLWRFLMDYKSCRRTYSVFL